MYSVLIVDDEEDVRKSIIAKTALMHGSFQVIGEAENGREALELCEKELPDLLITDINMPYINGLELLEQLNDRYNPPFAIFLTAYDEFDYARKAVMLNAVEYVLKPVTSEEFITILKRVKQRLDEERAKREDVEALRSRFEMSLPVLREKFLSLLLTGQLTLAEIQDKAMAYGLDMLLNRCCLAGVIMIDENQSQDSWGLSGLDDKELIQFSVFNIACEIMNRSQYGIGFLYGDNIVLISLCGGDTDTLVSQSLRAFEEICQNIKKYLNLTVTIGVGGPCQDISRIKGSCKDAVTACNYRVMLGGDRVIYIRDVEPDMYDDFAFNEIDGRKLNNSLRTCELDKTERMIDCFFNKASARGLLGNEYRFYLMEIVMTIMRTAKDMKIDSMMDFTEPLSILGSTDLLEIKTWIKTLCRKLTELIASKRVDTNKTIVTQAKDFVHQNYMQPDMNIDKACKHLHISPSYFCTLFKKETNDTFINYLHKYRMQSAKELLRTTDLKLREIAQMVGYPDSSYFSFSFKKTFGISPREYRQG